MPQYGSVERMADTTRWLTRKQAADFIGCHLRTVENYLNTGKLTKHKDGRGRIWIDREEIEALLTPVPVVESANR